MSSHGRRPSNVSTTSSLDGRRPSQQYGLSSSSPQNSRRSSRNYGAPMSRTNSNMGLYGGPGPAGPDMQESSLADELAGAWDEDEDTYGDGEDLSGLEEGDIDGTDSPQQLDGFNSAETSTSHHRRSTPHGQRQSIPNDAESVDEDSKQPRDSGIAVDMDGEHGPERTRTQEHPEPESLQKTSPSKRHGRTPSSSANTTNKHSRQRSRYDGSEFDDAVASSGTEDNLPTSLSSRIDEIAWLASRPDDSLPSSSGPSRQNPTSTLSSASASASMATVKEEGESPLLSSTSASSSSSSSIESPIPRLTSSLRDLSTLQQSNVETHTSRLITSHTALATHLAYQTRNIQSLSFPIISPLSLPPDEEYVDSLLPLLLSSLEALPQPTHLALSSLSQVSTATTALLSSLAAVSDSLHMSRQTMTVASRRLKSAREAAAELRKEQSKDEQGRAWIKSGNWDKKLRDRDAKRVCGEVVSGFEEVCGAWRQRLLAAAAQPSSSQTKVY